ncbi:MULTISPECIES: DUF3093 domain-containing protein [unclassified Leucobacter]|uniref:DUF3093 domain-containing protein n=1 Tax=unclassified Leucobacter TaxID=2621730 RepID=UPI00165E6A81|nr:MULTISPECIES: DUF3093 domain-containing protein [unclassified Leucobacter]MBC9926741.1 DUF3093 domain-containing protein [Leucobacter sp. cx-169]
MTSYSERLWPTPWLFVATLLILPAVALALTPINVTVAIISAILSYLIVGAIMLLSAPKISIVDGVFTAGPARIPVAMLGAVDELSDTELRVAIGPGCDARAHLLIRGWIHSGVRVEITDPADPAPYWVLTTRRPAELAAAINKARSAT